MTKVLFALVVELLLIPAADAQAQNSPPGGAPPTRRTVRAPSSPDSTNARSRRPPRPVQLWSADLTLAGVYDSNVERDDDEHGTQGLAGTVVVGHQNRPVRPTFQMDYGVTARTFTRTESWDRVSHRVRAVYDRPLAERWNFGALGLASLGIPTTEFRRANQVVVMPSIEYQPDDVHRARVYVAFRERWYRDSTRTTAFSPYAGVDYRYRWEPWHYGDLSYRFETNRAQLVSYRFLRSTYGIDYTRPFTPRDRGRLGIIFRSERYDGQPVTVGGVVVDRKDTRWIPSVSWIRDFDRQWRLQADYRFLARRTNGARPDFESHRLASTLRYHWGAR